MMLIVHPRLPYFNLHPLFLFALYLVLADQQLHHLIVILVCYTVEPIQN